MSSPRRPGNVDFIVAANQLITHASDPTTRAPRSLASWPAIDPTLPAAAGTTIVVGSRSRMLGLKGLACREGGAVTDYRPMTLADLAGRLASTVDVKVRWKLVWEFLEECRWESADGQLKLLENEPPPTGDERWDTLLAALAEHLAAGHDAAPPSWAELRVLHRPWFPGELRIQRAEALVWAPAAFRKHGVYLSARDLEAA